MARDAQYLSDMLGRGESLTGLDSLAYLGIGMGRKMFPMPGANPPAQAPPAIQDIDEMGMGYGEDVRARAQERRMAAMESPDAGLPQGLGLPQMPENVLPGVIQSLAPGIGLALGQGGRALSGTLRAGAAPTIQDVAAMGHRPANKVPGIEKYERNTGVLESDPMKLQDVPDVPQYSLLRAEPKKGDPATIGQLNDEDNYQRVLDLTRKGIEQGGMAWYNTDPLRLAAVAELGEEAGNLFHKAFADKLAVTSPRNKVRGNIRSASFHQVEEAQGRAPSPEQPAYPYGHLAHKTHVRGLQRLREGPLSGMDQPKTSSYGENLSGNYQPYTSDIHNVRGIGLNKASGKPELDAPSSTQYPGVERFGRRIAEELGITPAQQQSSLWMGAAADTGVANPEIFMQAVNAVVNRTAELRQIKPEQVLKEFFRGERPFLSVGGPVDLGLGPTANETLEGLYGSQGANAPKQSEEDIY